MKNYSKQEVFALALDAYRGISTHKDYTPEERHNGMNQYLKELAQDCRRNEIEIFEIMETVLSQELPKRLKNTIGKFAEVKPFTDGETVEFIVKNGKIKAVTVALGSTVRRQRVDNRKITIETEAIQAKVYESIKRVKAGLVDFVELTDDVMDAIEDEIYKNIHRTLIGAYGSMPPKNIHDSDSVVEKELDKLINVVKSYGNPIIFGTFLGVSQLPLDGSDSSKEDIRNQGYIGKYKGTSVVALENSFEDEDNEIPILDDQYLFIIPQGKERIVKVALEGTANVRGEDGKDWTKNFEAMQQAGVAIITYNNFAMYKNNSL